MKQIVVYIYALLTVVGSALTDGELLQERQSQTETAITIIFDNSGSMQRDGKIVQAKQAFLAWLSGQDSQTRFSLIHFSQDGTLAVPLGDNTLNEVSAVVRSLQPEGGTPIVSCLKLAHRKIQKRRLDFSPYERHLVVVFTDGGESRDPRGNDGVADEILKLRADGIEVMGIGFHGQGDYMKGAATQYFNAGNTRELQKGLDQVVAEIDPNVEVDMTSDEKRLMDDQVVENVEEKVAAQEAESEGGSGLWKVLLFIGVIILIFKKLF